MAVMIYLRQGDGAPRTRLARCSIFVEHCLEISRWTHAQTFARGSRTMRYGMTAMTHPRGSVPRFRHAVPLLALSACATAAKTPMAVAPTPNPCPRTVLAPHPFEAAEKATPGQQSLVGAVTDASSKLRLGDTVVSLRCVASIRDQYVVVTDEDGWFRWLADSGYGPDCDEVVIRFELDSYYTLEETVSTHPDTTVEMKAQLVPNECRPVAVPVLRATRS
jgi:hypothetical protein